jgi:hypothetical protein
MVFEHIIYPPYILSDNFILLRLDRKHWPWRSKSESRLGTAFLRRLTKLLDDMRVTLKPLHELHIRAAAKYGPECLTFARHIARILRGRAGVIRAAGTVKRVSHAELARI